MNFIQSIKTCFRKYVDFKGRAMRSEFWWFQLVMVGLTYIAFAFDHLMLEYSLEDTVTPLAFFLTVVFLLPGTAVMARRLHDIGWSGWVQLPAFASYLAYLDVWFPGFSVSTFGGLFVLGGMAYWIGLCLVLIKDSQVQTNKFGPNPKNPDMGEVFS